jgi:hypothetical protein
MEKTGFEGSTFVVDDFNSEILIKELLRAMIG